MEEERQEGESNLPSKKRKQIYTGSSQRSKQRKITEVTSKISNELQSCKSLPVLLDCPIVDNCHNENCVNSTIINQSDDDDDSDEDADQSNCKSFDVGASNSSSSCEESLSQKLIAWSAVHNVTHSALTDLLHILQNFNANLPLDSRTLLQTSKNIDSVVCGEGSFIYFGLERGIQKKVKSGLTNPNYPFSRKLESKFNNKSVLTVTLNTDGLPVHSSSTNCFWPILAVVDQAVNKTPFVVALYYGESKPSDSNSFFQPLVNECLNLEENGILINGEQFFFQISCIIADSPARSFLKCITSHNSFHGCEKCEQEGTYAGRTIWPYCKNYNLLRNDLSFKNLCYDDHQRAKSVLSNLNVGLVTQVPLDYMHLVCLGVMKRLIRIWFDKGPKKCRLRSSDTQSISERLLSVRKNIPKEFSRKPRSIKMFKYWKATEFRTFLLYLGPVVLQGILPNPLYNHFLLLHCAIVILASDKSENVEWRNYAHKLLHIFVEHVEKLYCKELLVYNFHNLLHLANDVENFGRLDFFSAFPFESFMNKIKRLIHGPANPLKQVAKRLMERELLDHSPLSKGKRVTYKNGTIKSFKLENSECIGGILSKDSCFLTNDNNIIVIEAIEKTSSQCAFKIHCKQFLSKSDFYALPLKSCQLGIHVVKKCEIRNTTISSHDLCTKGILLPNFRDSSSHIFMPFCNMELCC